MVQVVEVLGQQRLDRTALAGRDHAQLAVNGRGEWPAIELNPGSGLSRVGAGSSSWRRALWAQALQSPARFCSHVSCAKPAQRLVAAGLKDLDLVFNPVAWLTRLAVLRDCGNSGSPATPSSTWARCQT